MKLLVISQLSLLLFATSNEGDSRPPQIWSSKFREVGVEIWARLSVGDGKVTAEEVINDFYKNWGSFHDGDGQLDIGYALFQLEDDPVPYLRKMMQHKEAKERASAALIAGFVGDIRLREDLQRLKADESKLGQFPGDWFWDTVGDAAEESLQTLDGESLSRLLIKSGSKPAAWLKVAEEKNGEQSVPPKSDRAGG